MDQYGQEYPSWEFPYLRQDGCGGKEECLEVVELGLERKLVDLKRNNEQASEFHHLT